MMVTTTRIIAWDDGLALRLTRPMAKLVGVGEGTLVRVIAESGRVVIQTEVKPTLEQMLSAFDPKLHGGEIFA